MAHTVDANIIFKVYSPTSSPWFYKAYYTLENKNKRVERERVSRGKFARLLALEGQSCIDGEGDA